MRRRTLTLIIVVLTSIVTAAGVYTINRSYGPSREEWVRLVVGRFESLATYDQAEALYGSKALNSCYGVFRYPNGDNPLQQFQPGDVWISLFQLLDL